LQQILLTFICYLFFRCIVLLINAKTLDEFKTIMTDILTLSMSRYCGKLTESPDCDCPSEVAKKQLLNKIKGNLF